VARPPRWGRHDAHTGDLLHFFKGHFDTTIGLKVESSSYENITKAIGVAPEHTLFATDNILEVHASSPEEEGLVRLAVISK
jgi:enolase-phosphatase E1